MQVSVFVGGTGAGDVAKEIATVAGVTEVLVNGSASYDHAIAENVAKGLAELQASKSFTHILVSTNQ
jgi:electron transfer flavoprotein alpha subunit